MLRKINIYLIISSDANSKVDHFSEHFRRKLRIIKLHLYCIRTRTILMKYPINWDSDFIYDNF